MRYIWLVRRGGKISRELSTEGLLKLVNSGSIKRNDWIRRGDQTEWRPAVDLGKLLRMSGVGAEKKEAAGSAGTNWRIVALAALVTCLVGVPLLWWSLRFANVNDASESVGAAQQVAGLDSPNSLPSEENLASLRTRPHVPVATDKNDDGAAHRSKPESQRPKVTNPPAPVAPAVTRLSKEVLAANTIEYARKLQSSILDGHLDVMANGFWGGQRGGIVEWDGRTDVFVSAESIARVPTDGVAFAAEFGINFTSMIGQIAADDIEALRDDQKRILRDVFDLETDGNRETDALDTVPSMFVAELKRAVREKRLALMARLARAYMDRALPSEIGAKASAQFFAIHKQTIDMEFATAAIETRFVKRYLEAVNPPQKKNENLSLVRASTIDELLKLINGGAPLDNTGARHAMVAACNTGKEMWLRLMLEAGVPADWPSGTYGGIHELPKKGGNIALSMLDRLLDAGADPRAKDHKGESAIEKAKASRYESPVKTRLLSL